MTWKKPQKGEVVRCFLGIDAGSTTTKFVLLDEQEEILDSFYAPNEGDPLKVAKEALICLRKRYEEAGAELEILSAGTTGYGEMLFSKAFEIPCHTVETVAHARRLFYFGYWWTGYESNLVRGWSYHKYFIK